MLKKYKFNPTIFKAYDVRGKVNEQEITEETAFFLGLCLGKLANGGKVCVGRDARAHSLMLAQSLIKGLLEMGVEVCDLGLIPTPVAYFSVPFLKADASVMVTGSHNPPEYNGFKFTLANGSLSGNELQKFIKIAEEGLAISQKKGELKVVNLEKEYIKQAIKKLDFGKRKLKIGLDCMNGSGGEIVKEVSKMFPFEFVLRNCEMTGYFGEKLPEPSKPSNIADLQNFLHKEKLDFVFAFDGDADRVLLITHEKVYYGDDITLLLAYIILPENQERKVIFDVKSSIVLENEIAKLGGVPIIFKTGHSLIKQKMQEENAVLAGEMSGHIYINDGKFYPFDDGIYCFLRILEFISNNKEMPQFQHTFKTGELKLHVPNKEQFLTKVKERLLKEKPSKVIEIDGIKAYFQNNTASFLARPSNTEDVIILRLESFKEAYFHKLEKILNELKSAIPSK